MKKSLLLLCGISCFFSLHAETNATAPKTEKKSSTKAQKENNASRSKKLLEQKVKEQMEREQKYAKEQRFYQGDAYDLKAHEVDPNSLPDVKEIEPDYDFDITDVYRDDI
jgi:hypothetical protein